MNWYWSWWLECQCHVNVRFAVSSRWLATTAIWNWPDFFPKMLLLLEHKYGKPPNWEVESAKRTRTNISSLELQPSIFRCFRFTPPKTKMEPRTGGWVQMMFLFNLCDFQVPVVSFPSSKEPTVILVVVITGETFQKEFWIGKGPSVCIVKVWSSNLFRVDGCMNHPSSKNMPNSSWDHVSPSAISRYKHLKKGSLKDLNLALWMWVLDFGIFLNFSLFATHVGTLGP